MTDHPALIRARAALAAGDALAAAAVLPEVVAALEAAQKAAPVARVKPLVWRDFGTAPRDGSRILAKGGGLNDICICAYNDRVGCWDCDSVTLDDTDNEPEGYNRPIYWMPLAALEPAPADAGGVEGRPDAPCHIVEYTNWRGETARRTIIPIRMWWGKTEWHPQEQWMLTAWDVEKGAPRDFAWQDMKPVQNGATSAAVTAQRAEDAEKTVEPVAWLCEDLIFEGEKSVVTKREHAEARMNRPADWRVTPLYATSTPDVSALVEAGNYLSRVVDFLLSESDYRGNDVLLPVKQGSNVHSVGSARAALAAMEGRK